MASPVEPTSGDNRYFTDPESGAEMARLLDQDHLLTTEMGGLFPELEEAEPAKIQQVLDIGCGPGGWVQEVAFRYPEKQATGIDISRAMIDYANAQARVQGLNNVHFRVMDATGPLDFPDNTFDMVNARLIAFWQTTTWPSFMRELMRITRPGGIIRLTESEWGMTNSLAFEQNMGLFYRAMKQTGQSFSPDGRILGITPMLKRFLRDAGCVDVRHKAHMIDFSAGAPAHYGFSKDFRVAYKLFQPYLVSVGVATEEEADRIYDQMVLDMMKDTFCGIMFVLTAWGHKPGQQE